MCSRCSTVCCTNCTRRMCSGRAACAAPRQTPPLPTSSPGSLHLHLAGQHGDGDGRVHHQARAPRQAHLLGSKAGERACPPAGRRALRCAAQLVHICMRRTLRRRSAACLSCMVAGNCSSGAGKEAARCLSRLLTLCWLPPCRSRRPCRPPMGGARVPCSPRAPPLRSTPRFHTGTTSAGLGSGVARQRGGQLLSGVRHHQAPPAGRRVRVCLHHGADGAAGAGAGVGWLGTTSGAWPA